MLRISRVLVQNSEKILFLLILIALFCRIFSIFVVPEPAYNDSVYHLNLAKDLIEGNPLPSNAPPLLYHFVLAAFFGLTGLPMVWPFVKVIPLLVMIVQAALAFLLFKKIFPKTYQIPLLFVLAYPWLTRIGSVNMVESFAATVLLFFVYSFYSWVESTNKSSEIKYLALTFFALLLVSFSKLTIAVALPAMLVGVLIVLFWKYGPAHFLCKSGSKREIIPKKFLLFIVLFFVAILLSASFFIFSYLNSGASASVTESYLPIDKVTSINLLNAFNPEILFRAYLSFFDFPPSMAASKIPLISALPIFLIAALFAVMVFPIFFVATRQIILEIISGAKRIGEFLRKTKPIAPLRIFFLVIIFSMLLGLIPVVHVIRGDWYIRYFVPFFPFFGILLGAGFLRLQGRTKFILISSLILFSLFSFALTSGSALFYYSVQEKDAPLFTYLDAHPEISKIASVGKARELNYYSGQEIIQLDLAENFSVSELSTELKSKGALFVASTCYSDSLSEKLPLLEETGLIQKVFEQGCAKIYKVVR
ncbi:MAG: hypothetical protein NTZ73_01090 [Candidatus Diapherotrites archaeon]|nr:hypothetical protein [Candidatus Diapherotrites archaeon]